MSTTIAKDSNVTLNEEKNLPRSKLPNRAATKSALGQQAQQSNYLTCQLLGLQSHETSPTIAAKFASLVCS